MIMRPFLPLIFFVALFLGLGIYYEIQGVPFAFYQIPSPIAALAAIVLAIILAHGKFEKRIESLVRGMGQSNVITMCAIYLLAGAFSAVTKASGSVDAAVNFGLSLTPLAFILPVFFILSSILSLAMGTSMGTISALGPIALAISQMTSISSMSLFGALVGGAMFGDNLSVISDTTIAATRTQGARMNDKFKENFKLVLPAAILTIILLALPANSAEKLDIGAYSLLSLIPYLLLLVMALLGLNVFVTLTVGIFAAGILGFSTIDGFNFLRFANLIYDGFKEMQEIFLLSMMMGGLGQMMKDQNGIIILQRALKKFTSLMGKNTRFHHFFTELGLMLSLILTNICVANNTVAILICGDFFREVSKAENISPRRSASILDIFSCIIQGLLPYGAQILLASQLSNLSPIELIKNVTYCYILLISVVLNMFYRSWKSDKI